jgi:hypothetical protein
MSKEENTFSEKSSDKIPERTKIEKKLITDLLSKYYDVFYKKKTIDICLELLKS